MADELFDDWMSAHGPDLKRAAGLLCGNEHDADELVQDTFVKIYIRWAKVSGMDNPAGYARRTLMNTYLSRWRRRQRDRAHAHLFVTDDSPDETQAIADRGELASWLSLLGSRQRAIVVLRYYYDMPAAEIADILGCRESTVRTQLMRALANLRENATTSVGERPPNREEA